MNLPFISKKRLVVYAVVLLVLVNLRPVVEPIDWLSLTVIHLGLIWGLAALGLNLLVRYTELGSFGHALFFGGGAYTAAVLANKFDVSSVLVLLLGGAVVALVLGVIAGYLARHYTGLVFGLFTLALAQLAFGIVKAQQFFNTTAGLSVRPGEAGIPTLFGITFEPSMYRFILYQFTLVLVVIGLIVMWMLANSPFGRALNSIGDNRLRARMIGIPVKRYVWIAMSISAIYGGVAGSMWVLTQQHVRPEQVLPFFRSGEMLFMVILGGVNTLFGPLIGGIVLRFLLDQMKLFTDVPSLPIGIFLVISIFLFPKGLVGTFNYETLQAQFDKTTGESDRLVDWPKNLLREFKVRAKQLLNGFMKFFTESK